LHPNGRPWIGTVGFALDSPAVGCHVAGAFRSVKLSPVLPVSEFFCSYISLAFRFGKKSFVCFVNRCIFQLLQGRTPVWNRVKNCSVTLHGPFTHTKVPGKTVTRCSLVGGAFRTCRCNQDRNHGKRDFTSASTFQFRRKDQQTTGNRCRKDGPRFRKDMVLLSLH
jgi:hypothetical protein